MAGADRIAGDAEAWRPRPAAATAAPARAALWADACWIGILLAAGSFQIGRGAAIEGAPFVFGALALIADRLGGLSRFDSVVARPSAPPWLVVLCVVASALIVGAGPAFGWPAGLLVMAGGLAAVRPMWGRREPALLRDDGEAEARRIRRTAIAWAAVAVALCLWELVSFFAGLPSARADWEHPALSDLVKPAVETPAGRAALFAAWLAGGWGFARRGWDGRARRQEPGGGEEP